jgi:hypothetical protein
MASPRTDKIFGYLKANGSYVWFRFSVDANGAYQFLFQTGTSAPDMALVNALPYFQPAYGYPGPTNSTGDVIDPSLVPSGGGGLTPVAVPANSSSAGSVNDVALDSDFFYYCYAANSWRQILGNEF